jgi:hypothetical protein
MNREFLPEAIVGITLGLLVAILAVYRTAGSLKPGTLRRGGMAPVLVYAVIGAPVLVWDGMAWWGLLLLLLLLGLPVAGMLLSGRRPFPDGEPAVWARRLVSVGLSAAMLIAAGQTLSLLSGVDPRVLVVVIAVVTALLVAQEGLAASSRIGSLAMWMMIVPVLIALALGFLLGNVGQAVDPIIVVAGPSLWTVLAVAVAFLVLGWVDAGLASSRTQAGWSPLRVLGGVFGVVILIAFGLLMFFGGAILAPSMQFFVVPANIDALPGLAGVLLAILTVLFAALVSSPLNGLRSQGDDAWRWVTLGATVAAILALLDPGLDEVVVAASLVAAAVVAARSSRGVVVGLVTATIAVVVLGATGHLAFDWPSVLAVLIVLGAGAVPSAANRSAAQPERERV